ncbi:MAG: 5-bromo-4-chloroindolyl phosphate hydrolysis family protein [Lachnospiraceae bacterium]|nr:5-bromo-4-chloroindolyl phosphate hydrolysis family protein [Lachnospiraceae bacterium]
MTSNDFKNIGEEIKDAIQTAIDSEDFSHLNQTIREGVEKATNMVEDGIKVAGKTAEQKIKKTAAYQSSMTKERKKKQEVALYHRTSGMKAGAIACMVLGYFSGTGLFLALAILFAVAMATGSFLLGFRISIAIMIPLCLVCTGVGIFGQLRLAMIRRFEKYKNCLNGKTYGNLSDFSSVLRKPVKYIQKDLEKMMDKGWFLEGHFDEQKTCLITSDDTYQEYIELNEKIKQQKKEEEEQQARGLSTEVKAVIREGKEFIEEIHKSNEAIAGKEISDKIASMEEIIEKIFEKIEQCPQRVKDIRKLMDYYLPTTVKLLHAYEELDRQPIQGENIVSSKKEIEESLDTLNVAFEKILDRLFQEQAWDVSSDISVLKTMLAQDGLTEKDF